MSEDSTDTLAQPAPTRALPGWPADLLDDVRAVARVLQVPAGTTLFEPGMACEQYIIVESGSARVEMVAESGRELVLYRVSSGHACPLTTACLIGNKPYRATAEAETDLTLWTLGRNAFEQLLGRSPAFRKLVFASFGDRMGCLMQRLEEVMTHGLDRRLAGFLLEQSDDDGIVRGTHYRIAVELGAVREAVSRRLKAFERDGWVQLGRGRVQVLDPSALRAAAAPDGLDG